MYRITEEYISVQKKLVIYIAIAMLAVLLLTGIVYFLVTGGLKTIDSTLSSAALGLGIGFAGSAAILLLSLNAMVKNMRAAAIEIDDKGIKRTYKNAVDAIPFGDVTGVRARVWKGKMTAVRIKYRYGARNHKAAIDVTGYERIGEIFDKLKEGVNDDRKTAIVKTAFNLNSPFVKIPFVALAAAFYIISILVFKLDYKAALIPIFLFLAFQNFFLRPYSRSSGNKYRTFEIVFGIVFIGISLIYGFLVASDAIGRNLAERQRVEKEVQLREKEAAGRISLKTYLAEKYAGVDPKTVDKLRIDMKKYGEEKGLEGFLTVEKIEGLEDYAALRILRLQNAGLEKINGLDSLNNLIVLDMVGNKIARIDGLGKLRRLVGLDLSDNRIGAIENIDNNPELDDLDLGWNNISKIEGLGKLKKLTILGLSANQIVEISGLGGNTSLKSLWLSRNKITKIQGLERLAQLSFLDLSENLITRIENLEKNPKLEEFQIEGNPVTSIDKRTYEFFKTKKVKLTEGYGSRARYIDEFIQDNNIRIE